MIGRQQATTVSLGCPVLDDDGCHAERKVLEDAMVNLQLRPLAIAIEVNLFCTGPQEGVETCSAKLPTTTRAVINPGQKTATWP
jgi:hypothetical protein